MHLILFHCRSLSSQHKLSIFLHTSMFDVRFSILNQKERLCQWVISTSRATVFTHPHWEPKQPHLLAAIVSLAFIVFPALQCGNIAETLQRCYRSTTWLGLSCTELRCMFSRPENKACVYVQLTVSFPDSLVVVWWRGVREESALPVVSSCQPKPIHCPLCHLTPCPHLQHGHGLGQPVHPWYSLTYLWECFRLSLHFHPAAHPLLVFSHHW